jgi:hypothetical protein
MRVGLIGSALFFVTTIAMLALAHYWFQWARPSAEAAAGSQMSLAITPSGPGRACATSAGAAPCLVPLGATFTAGVALDKYVLTDYDGDTIAGYPAIQLRVDYSGGLTLQPRAGLAEWVAPVCAAGGPFRLEREDPGAYLAMCSSGKTPGDDEVPELSAVGPFLEVDLACGPADSTETVTLNHGAPLSSHLVDDGMHDVVADGGVGESLTIHCLDFAADQDGDKCMTEFEASAVQKEGGNRDPLFFWDFYSVPTGPVWQRDHVIAVGDLAALVRRFGSNRSPPPSNA